MLKSLLLSLFFTSATTSVSEKNFHEFRLKTLNGGEFDFSLLKGKKVLLVNVASHCGYTPQYAELQKLSEQYADKLIVLGFPSNSFLQEMSNNDSIKAFCQKNYGITFTMFEKISVRGRDQHPLYQWLSKKELNGWNDQAPSWNFCKYLVDENGKLLKYYGSSTKPLSKEITDLL